MLLNKKRGTFPEVSFPGIPLTVQIQLSDVCASFAHVGTTWCPHGVVTDLEPTVCHRGRNLGVMLYVLSLHRTPALQNITNQLYLTLTLVHGCGSGGSPKAVVVGGGWAGYGAAHTLLKEGFQVTLLDAGAAPGGLSTGFRTAAGRSVEAGIKGCAPQTHNLFFSHHFCLVCFFSFCFGFFILLCCLHSLCLPASNHPLFGERM